MSEPTVMIQNVFASPQASFEDLLKAIVAKDSAYSERNQILAMLAHLLKFNGFTVGIGKHPVEDESWDEDWRTILFIDTTFGQLSWHFHDSEKHLLEGLPAYSKSWDGHSTAEKYLRLTQLMETAKLHNKEGHRKVEGLLGMDIRRNEKYGRHLG